MDDRDLTGRELHEIRHQMLIGISDEDLRMLLRRRERDAYALRMAAELGTRGCVECGHGTLPTPYACEYCKWWETDSVFPRPPGWGPLDETAADLAHGLTETIKRAAIVLEAVRGANGEDDEHLWPAYRERESEPIEDASEDIPVMPTWMQAATLTPQQQAQADEIMARVRRNGWDKRWPGTPHPTLADHVWCCLPPHGSYNPNIDAVQPCGSCDGRGIRRVRS